MATYDFEARQGATFDRSFTWKPGGTAADLTGFTARMQVRKTARSASTVVDLTTGSGLTLGADGSVRIVIAASVMAGIKAGSYVWDIDLIDGGGRVFDPLKGSFTVTAEVTR